MKNIILIAPANAGKGTQAKLIQEKYNIPHISMGELLRERRKIDDQIGRHIAETQDKGVLTDDSIVIEALKERITQPDCKNGYILEGYPRTVKQLNLYKDLLNEIGMDFGVAISLEIPYEMLLERMLSRVTCEKCEKIYNLSYEKAKPKVDGICDECGGKLVRRSDDTEEAFKVRYQVYLDNINPLLEEFNKMGVLYTIDASIDRDTTFKSIEAIIND